ncbi:MAG: exodeoxyribonuclease III [Verrucomicrobia bacterium]|nr:MAG: exodeoxyribonuclease III [Verrucomicrobiota bacterium]
MSTRPLRLISWNVNGVRAALRKGFNAFVAETQPDVLCLQETRAEPAQVQGLELPADFQQFWNPAQKRGYSGTAIFTRIPPVNVTRGMGVEAHDAEGRIITAEFEDFYLVNCYTPNSQRGLTRLDYRLEWDRAFLHYLKKLEKRKPVLFCGDINVAHTEIDLARPKDNVRNHGFTIEERTGFSRIIEAGFVDTFRLFEKGGGHYTWWSQMNNARARNVGWRIDYWVCSATLVPRIRRSWILKEVMGSDHCPVGLEME